MSISVKTVFHAGRDASEPGIVVQITTLRGSYMIWAGTWAGSEEDKEKALAAGHLGRDWACGMPDGVGRIAQSIVSRLADGSRPAQDC
ncbi:hypothetical protein FB45DRAFT_733585 [Roridomyces roridus]|uniref:Uncharacterized protein n=1 Tax=Roridomyces roridus TaxID=1738132 RepID=A0AAD7CH47_9AGAR|nr:hypothetical protein FB45DRAFT_733585 [Roridomyces roridus]